MSLHVVQTFAPGASDISGNNIYAAFAIVYVLACVGFVGYIFIYSRLMPLRAFVRAMKLSTGPKPVLLGNLRWRL